MNGSGSPFDSEETTELSTRDLRALKSLAASYTGTRSKFEIEALQTASEVSHPGGQGIDPLRRHGGDLQVQVTSQATMPQPPAGMNLPGKLQVGSLAYVAYPLKGAAPGRSAAP